MNSLTQVFKRGKNFLNRKLGAEIKTYRRLRKELAGLPRYQPTEVECLGFRVHIADGPSFLSAFNNIFLQKCYECPNTTEPIRILDCGANIGLSILFFKKAFPQAHITAFEADPKIASVLKKNIAANNLHDVQLVEAAVWNEETELSFQSEGADAGKVSESGSTTRVPAVRLRPYLERPVYMLKMDIEGAEKNVLADCKDLLRNVKYLVLEYHSYKNSPQELSSITQILSDAGFRYYIFSPYLYNPFLSNPVYCGMDQFLSIHAAREGDIKFAKEQ
jgi:FkbM family methyltransferase